MFNNSIDFDDIKTNPTSGTHMSVVDSIKRTRWQCGMKENVMDLSSQYTSEDTLEVCFNIVEGEYSGSKHFEFFNMWSENQIAANISRSRFKELCTACNKDPKTLNNFCDLYNSPIEITLKQSKQTNKNGTPYTNVTKIAKATNVPF